MPPTTQPPKIRNCPFCRIAMVASRTNARSSDFDHFQCLQCGTVIRYVDGDGSGHTDGAENSL